MIAGIGASVRSVISRKAARAMADAFDTFTASVHLAGALMMLSIPPYSETSLDARLRPIPGTPGTLSPDSPVNALKSFRSAGDGMLYFSQTSCGVMIWN